MAKKKIQKTPPLYVNTKKPKNNKLVDSSIYIILLLGLLAGVTVFFLALYAPAVLPIIIATPTIGFAIVCGIVTSLVVIVAASLFVSLLRVLFSGIYKEIAEFCNLKKGEKKESSIDENIEKNQETHSNSLSPRNGVDSHQISGKDSSDDPARLTEKLPFCETLNPSERKSEHQKNNPILPTEEKIASTGSMESEKALESKFNKATYLLKRVQSFFTTKATHQCAGFTDQKKMIPSLKNNSK
ncbi:MAG: hypothetical protein LEGION0398_MBIBDBAK_00265 [Legionellaceae bacterium]